MLISRSMKIVSSCSSEMILLIFEKLQVCEKVFNIQPLYLFSKSLDKSYNPFSLLSIVISFFGLNSIIILHNSDPILPLAQ